MPYLLATASKGPTLLGLPVAAPYSPPAFLSSSIQLSGIAFSATKPPSPTQVEYAFITPTTCDTLYPIRPVPIGM